jgi:hypothetical protein
MARELTEISAAERELRSWCEACGEEPNPAIIEMMRRGDWQRRQQRNKRVFRQSVARWNTWRRVQNRVPLPAPAVDADRSASRPRERRAARSSSAPTRGDPSEPDLAPVWPIRGFGPATVHIVQRCQRRRAKAAAA